MKWAPVIGSGAVFVMSLLFWVTHQAAPKQEFDCTMLIGGWHPDIPAKVREGCNFPNKMT